MKNKYKIGQKLYNKQDEKCIIILNLPTEDSDDFYGHDAYQTASGGYFTEGYLDKHFVTEEVYNSPLYKLMEELDD